ncbi:MAG: hypothetical protein ABH883_02680, partial [Candidatus Omnitrophota bacterium]
VWPNSWDWPGIRALRKQVDALLKQNIGLPRERVSNEGEGDGKTINPRDIPADNNCDIENPGGAKKIRILFVDDDPGVQNFFGRAFKRAFSEDTYEYIFANNGREAKEKLESSAFDLIMVDAVIPHFDEIERYLLTIDTAIPLVIQSGIYPRESLEDLLGPVLVERAWDLLLKPYSVEKDLFPLVKQLTREKILDPVEENGISDKTGIEIPVKTSGGKKPSQEGPKTIFIISSSLRAAIYLGIFILENEDEKYNITPLASVYALNDELKEVTPDIVISDVTMDDNDELDNILRAVREKNADAEFILMREKKEVPDEKMKDERILAVIEKPFHFDRVLAVLRGKYKDLTEYGREKFRIEESSRIFRSELSPAIDKHKGLIRIWKGYAAPRFQQSMMTRIRNNSQGGAYEVGFCDIEALVNFAVEKAVSENNVTILPYYELTESDIARLEASRANVIYMDFEKGVSLDENDIVQLNAIICAGIAYLMRSDKALLRLYKLLTKEASGRFEALSHIYDQPQLIKFSIKKAGINDTAELKKLNERMEEVLMAA